MLEILETIWLHTIYYIWAQACLKMYLQNVFTNHIYSIYIYEQDLAFNDLQFFIYAINLTKLHQTNPSDGVLSICQIELFDI